MAAHWSLIVGSNRKRWRMWNKRRQLLLLQTKLSSLCQNPVLTFGEKKSAWFWGRKGEESPQNGKKKKNQIHIDAPRRDWPQPSKKYQKIGSVVLGFRTLTLRFQNSNSWGSWTMHVNHPHRLWRCKAWKHSKLPWWPRCVTICLERYTLCQLATLRFSTSLFLAPL